MKLPCPETDLGELKPLSNTDDSLKPLVVNYSSNGIYNKDGYDQSYVLLSQGCLIT